MIELRQAENGDLQAVYRLVCELEQGSESVEFPAFEPVYLRNCSNADIMYLLAEEEGRAVGFGSMHVQWLLHHAGPVAEVQELVVSSAYQGRGIGRLLLDALKKDAARRGCLQLELSCNMRRTAANEFYGAMGFMKTSYKHVIKL